MKNLDADTFLELLSAKATVSRRPEEVTFELTYGCNLRCVHCYNPTHRAMPHELTTSEICTILDQIANLEVLTVTFTGGEPSVRPDIGDILRHARRQGLMTHLMTNATRITPSFTGLLQEAAVSQVNVSIYGATETTYEQMTAIQGSYRQFRQGLLNLAAASLPVVVRMPVTTINCKEVQACRQLVESCPRSPATRHRCNIALPLKTKSRSIRSCSLTGGRARPRNPVQPASPSLNVPAAKVDLRSLPMAK
jgi:MoaA/NifB/PqqE/SkfB family radical SAM enzyme